MSPRIENAHRRLLPLTVVALLLAAALPRPSQSVGDGDERPESRTSAVQAAGFGLSLGFHGHHGRFYHGHHRHYRPYYYYRPYNFYPYFHYYGGYYDYPRYSDRFYGRLDLDVKPKKTTQVYVDGNYVGVAGSYDGWPEYLWLEKDSYELIFYNPGYETIVRHVEVRPGAVLKIREEMRPGESIRPEELTTAKTAEAPRYTPGERYTPRAPNYERRAPERPAEPREPVSPTPPGLADARPEPARMKLSVAPADATVYLDGRFLGVAGEIGEERDGILIDPGEHVIEVVRPGYRGREVSFEAEPGDKVELEVELEIASKTGLSA